MPTFAAHDGTVLSYSLVGAGPTLLCHPGGPARPVTYLGDLGGLAAHRTLVRLDPRGVGASAAPADPATYGVDRLVDDVVALADHLGLDRFDLLGHSAGGNVAVLLAAAHPDRLAHAVLVCGGGRIAGLAPLGADEARAARSGEPWFADAVAAAEELFGGERPDPPRAAELEARIQPLYYGRWDDVTRAHAAEVMAATPGAGAAAGFYVAIDAAKLQAELGRCEAPVLSMAGSRDLMPTLAVAEALAALFPRGRAAVVEGAGHYPWVDEPDAFVSAVEGFLTGP